jgi:hypothetical protein
MAKALHLPPFPSLSWDGWYWRGPVTVPWYATAEVPELVIHPDPALSAPPADAPRPTDAQAAAFQYLVDLNSPLRQAVAAQMQKHVPEVAGADWPGIEAFFVLAAVIVFHPAADGVSYTGLVLNCLQWDYGYEHGVGIVTHRDRVVHFGMAEEGADDQIALKDLRRIARQNKKK